MGRFDFILMDDDERDELAKNAPPPDPELRTTRAIRGDVTEQPARNAVPSMFDPNFAQRVARATGGPAGGEVFENEPHQISEGGTEDPEMPSDPAAWYFAMVDDGDGLNVVFTPIAYWRIYRAQIDQHVEEALRDHLPSYLDEVTDSTFVVVPGHGAPNDEGIRQDLLSRGFQTNNEFAHHVAG